MTKFAPPKAKMPGLAEIAQRMKPLAYPKFENLFDLPPVPEGQFPAPDLVNHPPHYNGHPSGVECITITEHFGFNLGNAVKYIWRADSKGSPVEDLAKAKWYLEREIARREAALASTKIGASVRIRLPTDFKVAAAKGKKKAGRPSKDPNQ